jgi:hypothetical protein
MSISMEFWPIAISAVCVPALVAASSVIPQDLGVKYQWNTGSLPPKHHYAYTVTVDAQGQGQVSMQAGYGASPQWTEKFQVSSENLDALYGTLRENEFSTRRWRQTPIPPGGPYRSLVITANKQTFQVKDRVTKTQQAAANEMYDAVRFTVPETVWTKLQANRQKYVSQIKES